MPVDDDMIPIMATRVVIYGHCSTSASSVFLCVAACYASLVAQIVLLDAIIKI